MAEINIERIPKVTEFDQNTKYNFVHISYLQDSKNIQPNKLPSTISFVGKIENTKSINTSNYDKDFDPLRSDEYNGIETFKKETVPTYYFRNNNNQNDKIQYIFTNENEKTFFSLYTQSKGVFVKEDDMIEEKNRIEEEKKLEEEKRRKEENNIINGGECKNPAKGTLKKTINNVEYRCLRNQNNGYSWVKHNREGGKKRKTKKQKRQKKRSSKSRRKK